MIIGAERIRSELAGLEERAFADAYAPAGPAQDRLDMFGGIKAPLAHRRLVPETPEAARPRQLRAVRRAERAVALRCLKTLRRQLIRMQGWTVVFGDGSDLQVDGRCFDAARLSRDGEKILRWMTLRVGPVLVDQQLLAGNADEGRTLPGMLRRATPLLREAAGRGGRLLALLDAAYCEWPVIKALPKNCDWIVCANQYRGALGRLARAADLGAGRLSESARPGPLLTETPTIRALEVVPEVLAQAFRPPEHHVRYETVRVLPMQDRA